MIASLLKRFRQASHGFLKDERGAMAIFVAAGAVAFVGIAGISVDAARGYLVQSRLSSALDAAGLAGARVMFSPTRDAEILKYFNANFPPGYLGATVTPPSPPPTTPGQTALILSASATIDTTLTRVLGIDTLAVSAVTEITRATPSLDVVLAIDMSGSMTSNLDGKPRIEHAVDAAKLMTNILYNTPGVASLNVGLVPWSSKVNVTSNGIAFDPAATVAVPVPNFTNPITGASQSSVYLANNSIVPLLAPPPAAEPFVDGNGNGVRNASESFTDLNGNGVYDKDWHGCVFARYTDDGNTNDADLEVGPATIIGAPGAEWPAWELVDGRGEPDTDNKCTMTGSGYCVPCLNQGITPLQATQAAIDAAINALTTPEGSTEMLSGLAWAWRVLVPEPPFTEAPLDPNQQRIKAIVFLTDGAYTGWGNDAYKKAFGTSSASLQEARDRLEALATKIKNTGVRIYTVQFATTSGVQLMKDVATGPFSPFYSNAADGAELNLVFQQIADDLVELHISQ